MEGKSYTIALFNMHISHALGKIGKQVKMLLPSQTLAGYYAGENWLTKERPYDSTLDIQREFSIKRLNEILGIYYMDDPIKLCKNFPEVFKSRVGLFMCAWDIINCKCYYVKNKLENLEEDNLQATFLEELYIAVCLPGCEETWKEFKSKLERLSFAYYSYYTNDNEFYQHQNFNLKN
jgi:hypothetical protein